jgi:hypothetical protein
MSTFSGRIAWSLRWWFGALRLCPGGEGWSFDACAGQRAAQLLTPVGNITRRGVAVQHPHGCVAYVCDLVEDPGWDIGCLAGFQYLTLSAEAHFSGSLYYIVNFFLLLIMPWHLSTLWVERDVPHGEILRLDGGSAADKILRPAPSRIPASFYDTQVCDDHE